MTRLSVPFDPRERPHTKRADGTPLTKPSLGQRRARRRRAARAVRAARKFNR